VFTGSIGETDRLTLCTELYPAKWSSSSGALANPGRVRAAPRSLRNPGGGGGAVPQAVMLLCHMVESDMLL